MYNLAGIASEFMSPDVNYSEEAALTYDYISGPYSSSTYGVALVRDIPVASVPEPSSLALLGLGFAGLGVVRRKSKA